MEAIAVKFATAPSFVCIDPGTADPDVVQVGISFHSPDGKRVVILSVVCPLPRVL